MVASGLKEIQRFLQHRGKHFNIFARRLPQINFCRREVNHIELGPDLTDNNIMLSFIVVHELLQGIDLEPTFPRTGISNQSSTILVAFPRF